MNHFKQMAALLIVTVVGGWIGAAEPTVSKGEIDRAVAAIGDYELGKARGPLSEVERIIRATRGQVELRQHLEQQLIRMLQSTSSDECRLFICEQLWMIGTERSIPTLRGLLLDEKTAHMACIALGTQPSALASEVLIDAAKNAKGQALICIVNVLGDRREARSIAVLKRLLDEADETVVAAAASALGRIATAEAATLLGEARRRAGDQKRMALNKAYLQCAARLAERGQAGQARPMYQELFANREPLLYRRAALVGLIGLGGPEAVNLALSMLRDDNRMLQATAIAQVPTLKGEGVTRRFVEELPNLPASLQVVLIGALQERGDTAARPAIAAATASADAEVRVAAIRALGSMGDASSVPLLAQLASEGKSEAERRGAIISLRQLDGPGIDAAIVQSMQSAQGEARVQLIQVLSDRGAVEAVPALLKEAADGDSAIRSSAFKALGMLAEPKDLPGLIDLLIALPGEDGRSDAERAVVSVARKAADATKQSAAVLAALAKAQQTPVRLSLLRVLGAIGDQEAYAAVRGALDDPNSQVRNEVVRLLAAWPDPTPLATLFEIAAGAADESHRVLALRGYIRLVGVASDRTAEERVGMYGRAMELAKRIEEKRLVLAGLAGVKDAAALRMVRRCLDDLAVQEEAAAAAVAIAREVVRVRPSVAKDAMLKTLSVTKNATLRREAEQIIKEAETLDSSLRGSAFEKIEAVSLFDGETFEGWEGPLDVFRIEDGAIVGGSLKRALPRNEFLTTRREYRDFELRLQFKLLGQGANAGIQVRSRRIPNNNEMIGYQADLGDGYWGCLYDESRRNRVLARANDAELRKVLRLNDWNEYVIRGVGRRIQLWINGYQTVDYTEVDEQIEQVGLIGLQIHGGPPSEAWYREITIKELPRSGAP